MRGTLRGVQSVLERASLSLLDLPGGEAPPALHSRRGTPGAKSFPGNPDRNNDRGNSSIPGAGLPGPETDAERNPRALIPRPAGGSGAASASPESDSPGRGGGDGSRSVE